MKGTALLALIAFLGIQSIVQAQEQFQRNIQWNEAIQYGLEGDEDLKTIYFDGAQYEWEESTMPFYYEELPLKPGIVAQSVQLNNESYEALSLEEVKLARNWKIGANVKTILKNGMVDKKWRSYLSIYPFRQNPSNGQLEKLVSFDLAITTERTTNPRSKSRTYASQSALREGAWFRLGVTENKVYKLTYNFLRNIGMDVENLDPRNIQLFGYGQGQLPALNSIDRPDDMAENPIWVQGEADGRFDPSDYILFYGEGTTEWTYDTADAKFEHRVHLYSDTNFYFITVGGANGKRITQRASVNQAATHTVTSFNDFKFYERDEVNLIHSGSLWFGEVFDSQLSYNFSFDFPNIELGSPVNVELYTVARSGVSSAFKLRYQGQEFDQIMGVINLARYENGFGSARRGNYSFQPASSLLTFNLSYNKPQSVSKGWLNYIAVNARRALRFTGDQMMFRDVESAGPSLIADFQLINFNPNIKVWDVTDIFNVQEQQLQLAGGTASFRLPTDVLREFIAFESADSSVSFKGRVLPQNLHAQASVDMVIVSHPAFLSQSQQLANHHSNDGLRTVVVTPQQIYNEFSSGVQDPIAIRSFMKMLYDRAATPDDRPRYLLLMGDGSYDPKDRINGNTNFVIAFQSPNSLVPTASYVSDDYLGLLDDTEGVWNASSTVEEKLDIGIGRLPVKTTQEADAVVEKIIQYSQPTAMRDWRNEICFVGDDEDGVTHMTQADLLARKIEGNNREYNVSKIYLDAFQQESSSGGDRYPAVNAAINQQVEKGALIVNYTGHGGETGWTEERVVGIADITGWSNKQRLPLFITATCEFSRFDDPLRTSGGELVVLNPNGGGVGLLTTTRLVFSNPNYLLNDSFYNLVFQRDSEGKTKRIGDVFKEVKNNNSSSNNTRNFTLLGDPALKFAIPEMQVVTSAINGSPVSNQDTLKALSKVVVQGFVADQNGQKMSNYNGVVYPTVFDKRKQERTLNNDGGGVFQFNVQNSRLFKGKASVTNGDFSFSFFVPKDISYSFGNGKISYYAEDGSIDANGYSADFIIGGSTDSIISDNQGPQIDLFMNDRSFVFGGITDENPVIVADFFDEQGINTVGNGIGHDITAVIDQNTDKAIVLNEFYEAEIDNFQKGTVNFPLSGLSEGKHTLTLKAWDVLNNSSEVTVEFNVVTSKEIELDRVLNYPNPFTTNTQFWFQHNQPGVPLDVKVEIFTVAGKLVKSIEKVVVTDGFLVNDIQWNGRDDYGDRIGRGVYLYKLKVRSRNGSTAEKIERLVIL